MPREKPPASQPKGQAPDPSDSYERSHPEHESGQGRLDNNSKATPTPRADNLPKTVTHAQDGAKQVNAQESASRAEKPDPAEVDPEPLGWEPAARPSS